MNSPCRRHPDFPPFGRKTRRRIPQARPRPAPGRPRAGKHEVDLREAADEVARIKPELERSAEELRRFKTAEIERLAPEIEQSTREFLEHKEELKKEMQELQREFCSSSSEI